MDRGPESKTVRIIEALDQLLRARGRGTFSAVDRAVGRAPGWWQNRVQAGELSVGQLLAVLDALGLEPTTFLRQVLGEREETLGLHLPAGETPPIVVRAQERLEKNEGSPSDDRPAEGHEGAGLGMDFLEALDRKRYEEADRAAEEALAAVDDIELALLPRLLGVAGSTYRMQYLLQQAYHTLYAGLALARERQDPLAQANLIQRLAYVVADDGQHAQALRLSERAAWLYLRHGDRAGMGTALVDQGMALYYLERPAEAIEVQMLALDFLPQDRVHHRLAAQQGLALYHRSLGHLDEALKRADLAHELAPQVGALDRAKLTWLRAELHEEVGSLDRSESALQQVVESFRPLNLVETALATCDLVRVQLLQDRPAAAFGTARTMLALLEPLRHQRIVSAAIADLLRGGREGLTLVLVQRVRARIEAARRGPAARKTLKSKD